MAERERDVRADAAAFLLAQATSVAPGTQVRALTVSFVDEKGAEVTDLGAKDVAVVENGVTRDITSFKPDARPLAVAILLDSSAAVGEQLSAEPRRRRARAGRALPGGDALRALDDRRPSDQDRRPHQRQGRRGRRPAPRRPAGRQHHARRARRGLGGPREAGARGRAHAARRDHGNGTGAEQPRQAARGRGDRGERGRAARGGGRRQRERPRGADEPRLRLRSAGQPRPAAATTSCCPRWRSTARSRKLWAVVRGSYRLAYATTPDLKKRKLRIDVARPGTSVLLPAASAQEP